MTFAIELMIFVGVFALALGLLGTFVGHSSNENRKLRAAHESRNYGRQPWDNDKSNRRGNR